MPGKLLTHVLVATCILACAGQALGQNRERILLQSDLEGTNGVTPLEHGPHDGREKLKLAAFVQEELRRGQAELMEKMEDARKSKNIEMLNCLNEKYTKLGALLEVVTTASILMEESLNQNRPDALEREYKKVVLVHDYAKQLMESTEDCLNASGDVPNTEEVIRQVLEGDLEQEEIPGPIETMLDPDLGMIPCW